MAPCKDILRGSCISICHLDGEDICHLVGRRKISFGKREFMRPQEKKSEVGPIFWRQNQLFGRASKNVVWRRYCTNHQKAMMTKIEEKYQVALAVKGFAKIWRRKEINLPTIRQVMIS